jgi:uncharacterized repeat protein (TIGR01451 family)
MSLVRGYIRPLLLLLPALCQAQTQQGYIITTVAGGGLPLTPLPATSVSTPLPQSVAADAAGNVFFTTLNCVFKVDKYGVFTRVAGKSTLTGYSGDGDWATSAQLNTLKGIALDTAGNLYIADSGSNVIRKVTADGIIATVAGTGTPGYSGDGGRATAAQLNSPAGVAVDASGDLYIANTANRVVRKMAPNGTISTVVGNGTAGRSGDGGPATSAQLTGPTGVAADSFGNLYVADGSIRKVGADGTISTVTISDELTQSALVSGFQWRTLALAVDASGNLYTSDSFYADLGFPTDGFSVGPYCSVHETTRNGVVTVVAGQGNCAYSGDGAAAGAALWTPQGVAVDASGNVYIADTGNGRVREVTAGTITTIAGGGIAGGFSGDGGPATDAQFGLGGVGLDALGNLYLTDALNNRVRKVVADGTITTVAGNGTAGYSGDGGPATGAKLSSPSAANGDASGTLYIADAGNNVVRKVSPNGTITTVAGNGKVGYSGDGGPAVAAELNDPVSVAPDAFGNLYISDSRNNAVRKVAANGIITTVVAGGQGTALAEPLQVATDTQGNLYIADWLYDEIPKVTANGTLTTLLIDPTSGDAPAGVAVDSLGNVYFAASLHNRVRKAAADGAIATIAGGDGPVYSPGYSGDGGLGTSAKLNFPQSIAVSGTGDVYIADQDNDVVRLLVPVGGHALLGASMTHSENFAQGQMAATYSVVVSNNSLAGPTRGTVTVTEIPPAGLEFRYMSGIGWSCSGSTCTRSDALSAGASFAPITVNVTVAHETASQAINQVTVTGGGSPATIASDATTILTKKPPPRRR